MKTGRKEAPPLCTLRQFEEDYRGRHLLHGVIAEWAGRTPAAPAIVNHNSGETLDWATLERATSDLARHLLRLGFRKGDYLAASLPFLTGHILLEYACFKIGVIHTPLDLRLRPPEVLRSLG